MCKFYLLTIIPVSIEQHIRQIANETRYGSITVTIPPVRAATFIPLPGSFN